MQRLIVASLLATLHFSMASLAFACTPECGSGFTCNTKTNACDKLLTKDEDTAPPESAMPPTGTASARDMPEKTPLIPISQPAYTSPLGGAFDISAPSSPKDLPPIDPLRYYYVGAGETPPIFTETKLKDALQLAPLISTEVSGTVIAEESLSPRSAFSGFISYSPLKEQLSLMQQAIDAVTRETNILLGSAPETPPDPRNTLGDGYPGGKPLYDSGYIPRYHEDGTFSHFERLRTDLNVRTYRDIYSLIEGRYVAAETHIIHPEQLRANEDTQQTLAEKLRWTPVETPLPKASDQLIDSLPEIKPSPLPEKQTLQQFYDDALQSARARFAAATERSADALSNALSAQLKSVEAIGSSANIHAEEELRRALEEEAAAREAYNRLRPTRDGSPPSGAISDYLRYRMDLPEFTPADRVPSPFNLTPDTEPSVWRCLSSNTCVTQYGIFGSRWF